MNKKYIAVVCRLFVCSNALSWSATEKYMALAEREGMTIAQISDIHTGSFFNRVAVKGGVEMLMKEKPDMVFFTGDLVNNLATEVNEMVPDDAIKIAPPPPPPPDPQVVLPAPPPPPEPPINGSKVALPYVCPGAPFGAPKFVLLVR